MEQNFDQLQKLLALKKYEQPPPGYFGTFARRVLASIEERETAAPLTWWQKLGLDFDFKPALVCGLAVVVCGLLSAGVITSMVQEPEQSLGNLVTAVPMNAPMPHVLVGASDNSSTQPVFSASRFDHLNGRVEQVSFQPSHR